MTSTFQRARARGFTLIELLIVVIIVAILAAIAIPQFSSSTSDAQAAALDANLATVRTALEQYKVQHKNSYPGQAGSTIAQGKSCTAGTNKAGAAGTEAAVLAQLQYYSNADGVVCDAPSADFKFGPYLRQGLPVEPINNKRDVAVTSTGTPITASTDGGWAYDTASGQFIMNSTANDDGSATEANSTNPKRTYAAH